MIDSVLFGTNCHNSAISQARSMKFSPILNFFQKIRDTYDSILKTLQPMLSYRTIKSEFQLDTEGTYLNSVQKKLIFVNTWSFNML